MASLLSLRHIVVFLLISIVVWLFISVGLAAAAHVYGQQDQARSADVLIVLGSGLRRDGSPGDALRRRSIRAAELWSQGVAPYILCTGGQSEGQRRSEAEACREVLMANRVAGEAIYLEEQSRSTEENAIYSAEMMQARGWQDAVVVTDAFHLLRANWIFSDYSVQIYPSPVPSDRIRRSWYTQSLVREVFALQWQALKITLDLPYTYVSIG